MACLAGSSASSQAAPTSVRGCLQDNLRVLDERATLRISKNRPSAGEVTGVLEAGAMSGARAVRDRQVPMAPCCLSVDSSTWPPPDWAGHPRRDPYVTRYDGRAAPAGSGHLAFTPPGRVGRDRLLDLRYYEPPASAMAPKDLAAESLIARGMDPARQLTPAGVGGFSEAYFVHPPVPDGLLAEWEAKATLQGRPGLVAEEREAWVRANATEVIKIRRLRAAPGEIAENLLRDHAMEEVAVDMAARATYDGAPLVKVAVWRSSPEELSRGLVRQEVVTGPTAKAIEQAASTVIEAASSSVAAGSVSRGDLESARRVLAEAGLSPEEALDRVAALEDFYRRSHAGAVAFATENRLPLFGNLSADKTPTVIGLDYNHGKNVAWDANRKVWVMFDW